MTTEGLPGYAAAAGIVILCTAAGWLLRGVVEPRDVTLLYLAGVVVASVRLGLGPGLLASVAGIAAYNLVFVPPLFSFHVADSHAYVTFAVMLATALVAGPLSARVSHHARQAAARESEARNLFALTRTLAGTGDADAMAGAVADLLAPQGMSATLWQPGDPLGEDMRLAVEWVMAHARPAGCGSEVMASAPGLSLPVTADGECLGVLTITPADEANGFTPDERLRLDTFAAVLGQSLARARRADEAESAHVERENERLRNVLLSSLSHDLRTPLTALGGGLSALLRLRRKLPREAMDEVTALWGQFDRLQRFVDNLLRMAAISAGPLKLKLEPYMIPEIIGAALGDVAGRKGERSLRTVMTGNLPMVRVDGALISQVLNNLLDNAIRHTADDGVITVSAGIEGDRVRVSVADDGPGLPPGDPQRLFDRFHSGEDRSGGAGLGLAISRGIVTAHGGEITAANRTDGRGAVFTFTLPAGEAP